MKGAYVHCLEKGHQVKPEMDTERVPEGGGPVCLDVEGMQSADPVSICGPRILKLGATMVGARDCVFADVSFRADDCGLQTYVLEYTDGTVNEYADLDAVVERVSDDRSFTISAAIEMSAGAFFDCDNDEVSTLDFAYEWILAALGSPDDLYLPPVPEDIARIMETNEPRLKQAIFDSANVSDDLLVCGALLRPLVGDESAGPETTTSRTW